VCACVCQVVVVVVVVVESLNVVKSGIVFTWFL
jgi:hypothetical protein